VRARLLLVAAALTAAGCSDDDAAGVDSTVVDPATTPTTAVATTAMPPSTSSPSTASPRTTVPPETTPPVDEEALKAQIAEDYERAFYRRAEMLAAPSLRNLESRVARVLVQDSPAFETFVERIQELVALGDQVVPNDPNLYSATVEKVELVGNRPYRRAVVTVCEVDNRRQVTPPENSPTDEEVEVAGTGQLEVIRFEEPVRLTANGWLRYKTPREGVGFDEGTTCPPA
jgi:hypothetical protein